MEGIIIHLAAPLWAARFGVIDQNYWPDDAKPHRNAGKNISLGSDTVARHADVCAALGLSADPATAAIELAHIRARPRRPT